ncbi:MAG: nitroreductase family protein [Chloroflexi bacterium]|nr:nitroreductase family protein [Ardenticatenaceae bacterium]MBL1130745.1 nitroreductase family protein [Chloroflexota bacterium]NOG36840.1 nitroreductase family protein [Chloroflexota bacterium]GIK57945.1 MAG: nitroreductase [Chloroflexota bacterium]
MSDLYHTILTRRSIRRYRPDAVPSELIERLLTAAAYAPSAHNRQPWRFVVMTGAETKHRLATAMGQKLQADLAADGTPEAIMAQDVARSYARLTQAPLLILLCLTMADMDSYPDPTRQQHEWVMAGQSTAMAGQNLLLAAHEAGLGACWLCAPLFCAEVVRQTLDLPADWQPQALITVGYPAEVRTKPRHPLETRVMYR